jgi:DNA-binding MarR family transcriptional regulator
MIRKQLTFSILKIFILFIVTLLILNIFQIDINPKASAQNNDFGEIKIGLSTDNPASNQEVLLSVELIDYRNQSVTGIPLNITLTSLTSPPSVTNRQFLIDAEPKTDSNGIYTAIFNAPIYSFGYDATYEININAELTGGVPIHSNILFHVEEKKMDRKSGTHPSMAAPGTWFQVVLYDVDFEPVTVSVTQNGETRTHSWTASDFKSVGSTAVGKKGGGGERIISETFMARDDLSQIYRFEGDHETIPDDTITFTFLVTEIEGNTIFVDFEYLSNGEEATESFNIPSIPLNQPSVGITSGAGRWSFTTWLPEGDYDNDDILGTVQASKENIYGIGFSGSVNLKIFNEDTIVAEEELDSDNFLFYYEWEVPETLEIGNYTLTVEGNDFNDSYYIYQLEFYVGEVEEETGVPYEPVEDLIRILFIPLIAIIVILLSLGSYSRLKRRSLLQNVIRKRIYDHIKANPGNHFRAILNDLNLKMGTLTHHINVLEDNEYIKSKQDDMYRRFYVLEASTSRAILPKVQEKLLAMIKENPGINQSKLSKLVGTSRVAVNYHIKILKNGGMITIEKEGRDSHCYTVTV